jgi:RNA polymerase sigma factor (sigma-70 family)
MLYNRSALWRIMVDMLLAMSQQHSIGADTMQQTSETDLELIQACWNGEAQAWGRLLEKYERLVYSIPLNYGLSHHDAADIAQLTFTSLIQSLDTLAEDSRLGAWLATVARRNTWRVIERARRESVGDYEALAERLPSLGKPGRDQLERWELTEWLNNGLLQLNERCRSLLLALYLEPHEPSYAEVATRIGVPVGSIGPTRARCLERLKRALEEQ